MARHEVSIAFTLAGLCAGQPARGLSVGSIAGDDLAEIEGMVIFFGVQSFEIGVEKGRIHGRLVDDAALIVDAGDVDDRRLNLLGGLWSAGRIP